MSISKAALYGHPMAFGHDMAHQLFAKRVDLPSSGSHAEQLEDAPGEIYFTPGLGLEQEKIGPNPAILSAIQSVLSGEKAPVFIHFGVDYKGERPDCEESLMQRSLWFRARIAAYFMQGALYKAMDRGHRALFVGHSIGSNSIALGQALLYKQILKVLTGPNARAPISEERLQKLFQAFPAVLLLNPAVNPLQYPEVIGDHASHFDYRKGKYPRKGKRGPFIIPEDTKARLRESVTLPEGTVTEEDLKTPLLLARRHVLQSANDPFLTERMTDVYPETDQTGVAQVNGIGILDHLLIAPGRPPHQDAQDAVRSILQSALQTFREKSPHQTGGKPHPSGRKLDFDTPANDHPHVQAAIAIEALKKIQG